MLPSVIGRPLRRFLAATRLQPVADGLAHRIYLQRLLAQKRVYRFLDRSEDQHKLMLNIGGGYFMRRHWSVLDFPSKWYDGVSPFIDYQLDLTAPDPWPFADAQVQLFYSSHTLEHIPQAFCGQIFREIYRCLRPGGGVRLTCPDFDLAYDAFGRRDEAFFIKYPGQTMEERFLDYFATHLKRTTSPEELRTHYRELSRHDFADHFTRQIPPETQIEATGNHINWWNFEKLARELREAGFENVYRSEPQGSRFPEMRGEGRFTGFDSTHPEISLFVEAIK